MKTFRYIFGAFILTAMASCSLDNYDRPDAAIRGSFYDDQTGELIQQDIINGTKIRYVELGYSNPAQQSMVVKCDGTYQNKLMFSGKYDFYFEESNFVPPVRISGHIIKKGDNTLDFHVQPYIRVKEAVIRQEGRKIVGSFIIEPTVDSKVEYIGLFCHPDYAVGRELNFAKHEIKIDATVTGSKNYTLEIDLDDDSQSGKLKSGETYYLRVGAKINATGSKYNYAPAVTLTID